MHRMSRKETAALKELANGPILSPCRRPKILLRHLRNNVAESERRASIKFQSRDADPVPFNDDIPF